MREFGQLVLVGPGEAALVVGAPDGGAAADPAAAQRRAAPGAARVMLVAGAGEPGRPRRHAARPDGRAQYAAHLAVQSPALTGGQAAGWPARMDACPPEDLVGEEVPQPGDDLLIDEDGLDGAAAAFEYVVKFGRRHVEGVRSEPGKYSVLLVAAVSQRDALQLAHVAVAQLPSPGHKRHAVVPVQRRAAFQPLQAPGHAEMEENGRPIRGGDQPFAVPLRPCEAAAAQGVVKLPGSDTPQHARVGDVDVLDALAGGVLGEHLPESLHVR